MSNVSTLGSGYGKHKLMVLTFLATYSVRIISSVETPISRYVAATPTDVYLSLSPGQIRAFDGNLSCTVLAFGGERGWTLKA